MAHFSEACERNKDPILNILRNVLRDNKLVLEIGSGTAQHAVYFADNLPQIQWQPSDVHGNIPVIRDNLRKYRPVNIKDPVDLDVCNYPWPVGRVDAIFSANTLHIMSWDEVVKFFKGIGEVLDEDGLLCIYGPFRYHNAYTSESNAHFDKYLKMRDANSSIRDFEAVDELARQQDLILAQDNTMPANNQLIIWKRGINHGHE
jgi:cyclopropane fatty-acyl-phospholipid synthase-like methyltransferase